MSSWLGMGEGRIIIIPVAKDDTQRRPSAAWWLCRGGRHRRRFAVLPRGCSQAGMTSAGQTKQTPDITPIPIRPVCLPGQGLLATQVVFIPVCGKEHLSSGRGPSRALLNNAAGDSAPPSLEKPKSKPTQLAGVLGSESCGIGPCTCRHTCRHTVQLQIHVLSLTSFVTLGQQPTPWASVSSLVNRC